MVCCKSLTRGVRAQLAAMAGLSLDSLLSDDDEDSCVVCLDNVREVLFLNCSHMVSLCPFMYAKLWLLATIKKVQRHEET